LTARIWASALSMPESPTSAVVDGLQPASRDTNPKDPKNNPRMTTSDIARGEATTGSRPPNHKLMNLSFMVGYARCVRKLGMQFLVWLAVAAAALGPEVWSDAHAVPGGRWTDSWNSLWSMHFAHTSVASGHWPWWSDALNYPHGGAVLLPDVWGSFFAVAAVPLLGLSSAYTAWITVQLALSGWAMHGLAREWLRDSLDETAADRAAWVAGLGYATAPVLLAGAACGTTEAVAGAPPVLAAWAAWRALKSPSIKGTLLAGLALLFAGMASWYGVVIAAVFVAILGVLRMPALGVRAIAPLAAGLLLVVPLALWTQSVHSDPIHLATRDPAILDGIRASFGAASLLGLVWPVDAADIAIQSASDAGQGYLHTGYVGLSLLVAAVVSVCRQPRRCLPWLLAGAVCAVLALGPGTGGIRPYAWVDDLPGFRNLSLVWRLASGAGLAAALLAALATRGRLWACGLLGTAIVVESAFFAPTAGGVSTSDTSPSVVLTALAEEPEGAVLTLPFSVAHADLWRQTQHGQPITATINRRRSEAAAQLAASAETATWPELAATAEEMGVRYVLVFQSRSLQASNDRFLAHQAQNQARLVARDNRWSAYALW
jgi:hypothetical protein